MRIIRAFAWLRWRMFVNSLEKTGSRDALERFSLAIEKLGPLLAAILLVPSSIFVAGAGVAGGYLLAVNGHALPFDVARYLLLAVPVLAVLGPLFLPAADRTNPVRLLLLPIPRSTLYVAQSSASLGDPWIVLLVPLLGGIVIGLLAGSAFTAAVCSLVGGVLLLLVVVGLAGLSTSVLHLVVRDRRRGELATLIFIVLIPIVSMLPGLLGGASRHERGQPRTSIVPAWAAAAAARAQSGYPTELFVNGTRAAVAGDTARSAVALAGLGVFAAALHGIGFLVFRRILESPGTSGARRSRPMPAAWNARLPWLSPGASAVALAQVRLAMRTPRGRSIMLSPIAMFALFGIMMYRGSGEMDFGPFQFGRTGFGLAVFTSFLSLMSILPIAMNQFAVDNAGLTLALLSPLTDDDLLSGKASGNALITAGPALLTIAATLAVFRAGHPALWLSLLLGLISISLLVAPVAAIASATFPRNVDMNSIGRGSNAHGAANLIGLATFLASGVPPVGLAMIATRLLDRPWLAPVFVAAWCVAAYGISRLLFVPARRIFAARRENLGMIV